MKAVGTRCTKAVAIKTPVPKCRAKKRKVGGMRRRGNRLHISGKLHAAKETVSMAEGTRRAHVVVKERTYLTLTETSPQTAP